jgi:predicted N-formylglutamate amidohydrolase
MSIVEILGEPSPETELVITCEHAGNELPPDIDLGEQEKEWLEEHWGWDIGAERVVRRMVQREPSVAVLSRYSRLLCDVNRRLERWDLVRPHVQGEPVEFNDGLSESDIEERIARYHAPYHEATDNCLADVADLNPDFFLLSVHTFTPELNGEVRDMEIGLLFDYDQEHYIDEIHDEVAAEDFEVARNEPYSGKEGFIYSVERHGVNHDVRFLEIEIRNDLVDHAEGARDVADRLSDALRRVSWYGAR